MTLPGSAGNSFAGKTNTDVVHLVAVQYDGPAPSPTPKTLGLCRRRIRRKLARIAERIRTTKPISEAGHSTLASEMTLRGETFEPRSGLEGLDQEPKLMRLITAVYLAALILFGAVLLFSDALLVAQTGSMMPAFDPGDLLITAAPNRALVAGDIISFQMEGKLVTHRVVEVREDGIRTKGDFNHEADPWLVPPNAVKRVYLARIPYVGYVWAYVRTRDGWFRAVILPALLLILAETANIVRELWRKPREEVDGMKHAPLAGLALLAIGGRITLALGINGTRAEFYAVSDVEMHVSIASPTPDLHANRHTDGRRSRPNRRRPPSPKPEPEPRPAPPEAEPKSEDGSSAEASDAP